MADRNYRLPPPLHGFAQAVDIGGYARRTEPGARFELPGIRTLEPTTERDTRPGPSPSMELILGRRVQPLGSLSSHRAVSDDGYRLAPSRYVTHTQDTYTSARHTPRTFTCMLMRIVPDADAIVFRGVDDRRRPTQQYHHHHSQGIQSTPVRHRTAESIHPLPSLTPWNTTTPASRQWAMPMTPPPPSPPPPPPGQTMSNRDSPGLEARHYRSRYLMTDSPSQLPAVRRVRSESLSSSSDERRELEQEPATSSTTNRQSKKKRPPRICTTPGCDKLVVDRGVCIRHGGGKRCNVDGCNCRAQNRGLCWKHGGFTICKIDGCSKRAKSRGICWSHGGGTQCKAEDCEKIAVSRGRCWAHGGGKRCKIPECQKPAALRTDNYCTEHYAHLRVTGTGDDHGQAVKREPTMLSTIDGRAEYSYGR